MTESRRYILKGKVPVEINDAMAWALWWESANHRVAYDRIEEAEVSTVFLGQDYGDGQGPPVLFETLAFGGDIEISRRYSTWSEAEAGHREVVAEVEQCIRERPYFD